MDQYLLCRIPEFTGLPLVNSNFDVSSKTLTLSNSTLFSADNTASRIFKVGPRTRIAIIRAANFNAVSAGGTYQVGTLDEEDRPVAETCAVITRTDGNTNNMFVINLQTDWYIHRSGARSEEHTSELQSRLHLVCRLLLEKKKYHLPSSLLSSSLPSFLLSSFSFSPPLFSLFFF